MLKGHDVDIVRYRLQPSPTRPETAVLAVTIRNNCAEARRINYTARVYADDAGPPIAVGQPFFKTGDVFGPNEERDYLYGWCAKDGACPRVTTDQKVFFRTNWTKPDSDESRCLDVGASRCMSADPWIVSTIDDLLALPTATPLVRRAADFGVVIRRGELSPGAIGSYRPRTKTITLSNELDTYSEFERATVLVHELRHAVDHADNKLGQSSDDCFRAESRAFQQQSEVWRALWRNKLPTSTDSITRTLNRVATLLATDPGAFDETLRRVYGEHCD